MWTDALGKPLTLRSEGSLAAVNDFVEGFIASEARAVNILQAQEDGSAIVQAYCAALHLFAESAEAPANARPFSDAPLRQHHMGQRMESPRLLAAQGDGAAGRRLGLFQ